jgi:microcystin-dependent protein
MLFSGNASGMEMTVKTESSGELQGIAQCKWKLDISGISQQVEARLLNTHGKPIHLPIRFTAKVENASIIAYQLAPDCESTSAHISDFCAFMAEHIQKYSNKTWPDLDKDGAVTIKDMIDALLCFLDADNLPFRNIRSTGFYPAGLKANAGEALNHLVKIIPPGMIMAFANERAPEGWLECDGQSVSRANYQKLYEAIGDRFGKSARVGTFKLPDLRGEFIRGWDHNRKVDPDRTFGMFQDCMQQIHTHLDSGHTHLDKGHGHDWQAADYHAHASAVQVDSNIEQPPGTGVAPAPTASPNFSIKTGKAALTNEKAVLNEPVAFNDNAAPQVGQETRPRNIALMYCIKH